MKSLDDFDVAARETAVIRRQFERLHRETLSLPASSDELVAVRARHASALSMFADAFSDYENGFSDYNQETLGAGDRRFNAAQRRMRSALIKLQDIQNQLERSQEG